MIQVLRANTPACKRRSDCYGIIEHALRQLESIGYVILFFQILAETSSNFSDFPHKIEYVVTVKNKE